jgi:polysaccharide deacetylase family protein (PEP-CTERM system associated)
MSATRDHAAIAPGILTVDVEDWHHAMVKDPARWDDYEDRVVAPTLRLLDLFAAAGATATFFVLGHVAERHPELVRRIRDDGHEVACHGHHHLSLEWLDAPAFEADLVRALEAIDRAGGERVTAYRAPYFSLNARTAWAEPVLARHGIVADSSVFPLKFGYYGQNGTPNVPHRRGGLDEFPITLPELLGQRLPLTGGFYMRFFPAGWTSWAVRRVQRAGHTPMFYLHPWEIDPGQPRIAVGRFLTLRHYLGLDRAEAKLVRLLREHPWKSLRDVRAAAAA